MRKKMKQFVGAKYKLADQIDGLDVMDKHYDRKYQDMQNRMDKFYDEISTLEDSMSEVEDRMLSIRQQKISGDNVYEFLLLFDKLYDRFTDCPTAHCGRREQHFSVGAFASPTVRFGRQLQTLNGVTAHCRSLI